MVRGTQSIILINTAESRCEPGARNLSETFRYRCEQSACMNVRPDTSGRRHWNGDINSSSSSYGRRWLMSEQMDDESGKEKRRANIDSNEFEHQLPVLLVHSRSSFIFSATFSCSNERQPRDSADAASAVLMSAPPFGNCQQQQWRRQPNKADPCLLLCHHERTIHESITMTRLT